MNICFFIRDLNTSGGTERVSSVIANNLVDLGYNVKFITIEPVIQPFFRLSEKIELISLNNSIKNFHLNYIHNIFKLRKILLKNNIELIIDVCTSMSLISVPAIAGSNIKNISWEHFHAGLNWNVFTNRFARKLVSIFSDRIITLTHRDKVYFEDIYKAKNVDVIFNPITIQVNKKLKREDAINKLNLDTNKRYILAVGRLTEQKGFDMLLHIWEKTLLKISGDWHLLIVGSGELNDDLHNLVNKLKLNSSVSILPSNSNIDLFYTVSEIFVMTSRFEGLPLVLIETKFFGLPAISFDCPNGPREIIRNNIDGVLVEYLNIEKFSETLEKVLKDDQLIKSYSLQCSNDLDRFNLTSIINQWDILIKSI